jgi:FtsZ-interacting cell division protein ZipA
VEDDVGEQRVVQERAAEQRAAEQRASEQRASERRAAEQRSTGQRQAIVKAPGGARRARLTPAPDTDPSPESAVPREEGGIASAGSQGRGENDDRLRQDRPPHW